MVREDDPGRCIRIEHDVVVLSASDCAAGQTQMKGSKTAAIAFAIHGNSTAHPQMDDHRLTAFQGRHNVFRSSPSPQYPPSSQTIFNVPGNRPPQIPASF